jgi:hypothetical protein
MTEENNNCNITFFFDDNMVDTFDNDNNGNNGNYGICDNYNSCNSSQDDTMNISLLLDEFENTKLINDTELYVPHIIHYHENFTVKELLLICEYYGYAKELKSKKYNKEQIIFFLVDFETNHMNDDIVCKRKNIWFYMSEIKKDKFMKKYVLW